MRKTKKKTTLNVIDNGRIDVFAELSDVVAGRKVVGDGVPLAVVSARSTEADLVRAAPHDLGEVAFALLEVLVVVVVVRFFVPLVRHLAAC